MMAQRQRAYTSKKEIEMLPSRYFIAMKFSLNYPARARGIMRMDFNFSILMKKKKKHSNTCLYGCIASMPKFSNKKVGQKRESAGLKNYFQGKSLLKYLRNLQ